MSHARIKGAFDGWDRVRDAAIGSTLHAGGIGSIYKSIEVTQT